MVVVRWPCVSGPRATCWPTTPPPLLAEDATEALQERVRGWIADQSAEAIAAAAEGMAERVDSTPESARYRRADPGDHRRRPTG